jgi:hypothetical protein
MIERDRQIKNEYQMPRRQEKKTTTQRQLYYIILSIFFYSTSHPAATSTCWTIILHKAAEVTRDLQI